MLALCLVWLWTSCTFLNEKDENCVGLAYFAGKCLHYFAFGKRKGL